MSLTEKEAKATVKFEEAIDEAQQSWTLAEETAVRRKIDWHVVPLITIMYLFCFIDRTNIGNAKIQGMEKDIGLYGTRYNLALTIFYILYIIVEIPSNSILKKIGARIWLPLLTVGFGFVSIGTAFIKTYPQLIVVRLLLAITEGGMMPGISFYLSCFYKREELLFRLGLFASSASLAGAFGGLLATGLTSIPRWGAHGSELYTWRNIFFFEGLMTLSLGMLAPFFLPRGTEDCAFLNEKQRMIAKQRVAHEHTSNPDADMTWSDVRRGFFNINNQFCAFGFLCCSVAVHSLSLFMPTILRDMGYKPIQAQLRSVPPFAVACIIQVSSSYISDKTRRRGIFVMIFGVITVIGFAILRWSTDLHVKYGALFIVASGAFPSGIGFLAWGINNAGSSAARAFTSAYIYSIGTIGSITATWTYMERDKPLYHAGHSINLGFQLALTLLAVGATWYCHRENRIRDAGKRDHRLNGLNESQIRDLGYRHPSYRYMV